MATHEPSATPGEELDAGPFGPWLSAMRDVLARRGTSDVPCGTCTACCTSSQFVHVEPDETETLRRIPAELRFPAPGLPEGHVVLGYDREGRCPMFRDGGCSIYEHRPRTCRTYDCRILPAAGLLPDDGSKVAIAQQARRWRFSFATEQDRAAQEAVARAAAFVAAHPELFTDGGPPRHATHVAAVAVRLQPLFLTAEGRPATPTVEQARAEVERRRGDA